MHEIDVRVKCENCDGNGGWFTPGFGPPNKYSPVTECFKCNGDGKVMPEFPKVELDTKFLRAANKE